VLNRGAAFVAAPLALPDFSGPLALRLYRRNRGSSDPPSVRVSRPPAV